MSSGGRLRIGASASDCCVSRASALHAAIRARLVAPVDLEGMLSCLALWLERDLKRAFWQAVVSFLGRYNIGALSTLARSAES